MTSKRASALKKPMAAGRRWIARDGSGQKVLATAATLAEAIKQAQLRGELHPLLEQISTEDEDSPGPRLWRRTL